MSWLLALIIIGFFWNRLKGARRLREARRLLHRMGGVDSKPPRASPSPHQLLGGVARPLAPPAYRYRLALDDTKRRVC